MSLRNGAGFLNVDFPILTTRVQRMREWVSQETSPWKDQQHL